MFAVLHFPGFALQAALRHEPELGARPVALVDPGMTVPRVVDATPAARAAGVADAQTAPQALARCREVVIRHRSSAAESSAMEAILQCAFGFSPHLEATRPGTVTLDLRGLSGLNAPGGGPDPAALRRWAGRLRAELAGQHLSARVGVGPTPSVARHAAEWGTPSPAPAPGDSGDSGDPGDAVCLVEHPEAFMAGLPVEALGPSSDVADLIRRWGVRTVGQWLALGQAELAERLGLEALGLFAAASTTASRPLDLVRPPERFEECHEFDPEIETLEPLLFLLRRFLDALGRRLEILGLAAGRLVLRLELDSGAVLERALRPPEPTRRTDVLFRMLHTHLETVRTESPVKRVALTLDPARPEQKQLGLFEAAIRDPHQFQETLARLAALVGVDRVGSPRRENSHQTDAFRMVPPEFDRPAGAAGAGPADDGPPRNPLLRPAPVRRLRPRLDATVTTGAPAPGRDPGSPLTVRCTARQGVVRIAVGPWRTSGHWWDERHWEREEWDVALHRDGNIWRLVREGERWKVEAVLD